MEHMERIEDLIDCNSSGKMNISREQANFDLSFSNRSFIIAADTDDGFNNIDHELPPDCGRESLLILPELEGEEGRPSLGILHSPALKSIDDSILCPSICNDLQKISLLTFITEDPDVSEESVCNTSVEDTVFYDSVFIEANFVAAKIADGSILDTSFEENILDKTPQPDWGNQTDADEKEERICDTETVYKEVDRMLPQPVINLNCDRIVPSDGRLFAGISSNPRSRDARDILQQLSNIWSCDNLSNEQKLTGQTLLGDLADILCLNDGLNRDSMEDSGHYSNENESPNEKCELSNKANYMKVELSTKNRVKRLNHSFDVKDNTPKLSNHLSATTIKNVRTNDDCISNDLVNLKLKNIKTEKKTKGPLRAILPMNPIATTGDFQKFKISKRSEKTPTKQKEVFKGKINTPFLCKKLRPVAQSTPERTCGNVNINSTSSESRKKKFSCPVSPMARTSSNPSNNSLKQLKFDSISKADKKSNNVSMTRRKSASDMKASNTSAQMKRSYSVGKHNTVSAKQPLLQK